jgi:hypothetical protein
MNFDCFFFDEYLLWALEFVAFHFDNNYQLFGCFSLKMDFCFFYILHLYKLFWSCLSFNCNDYFETEKFFIRIAESYLTFALQKKKICFERFAYH